MTTKLSPMCHYDRYRHHQHDDSAPPQPQWASPTVGARSLRSRRLALRHHRPRRAGADERVHQRGLRQVPGPARHPHAARFEELISDEANDAVTPEQLFTAADDAMDVRTAGKIDKLIVPPSSPSPPPRSLKSITATAGAPNPVRMTRYGTESTGEPITSTC